MEGRQVLLKELGELLGFEDGAEDVLDHLMTIDDRDDLLDYLSQLLGSANEKVRAFVDNVNSVQKGEEPKLPPPTEPNTATPAPATIPETKDPPPPKKAVAPTNLSAVKKVPTNDAGVKSYPDAEKPPTSQSPSHLKPSVQDIVPKKDPAKPKPLAKTKLQKGKASFVCGCFGTYHKPLANCLACGRISCEKEGYDFCVFCGILVEPPPKGVSRNDKAWLHKERLLRFDREAAQNLVVIDDQADAAAAERMTWLTEDEMKEREEKQAEKERTMQQRPNLKLDLIL